MTTRNFTISMDGGAFDQAEAILSELGLDLQTYLKMSLMKLVKERRIPFELSASQPSSENRPFSPLSAPSADPARNIPYQRSAARETNKITNEMCQLIWQEYKLRHSSGGVNLMESAHLVSSQTGMNQGSAYIYFTIISNLVDGAPNTRTLKYKDLEFFIEKIKTEFPENALKSAIASLEASIPYWDEKVPGSFADKVRALVERLKGF